MYALILAATIGAPPDPPPLESRVASLEWRMSAAEYRLNRLEAMARRPDPPPLVARSGCSGSSFVSPVPAVRPVAGCFGSAAYPVVPLVATYATGYAQVQAVQLARPAASYVTGRGHTHTCYDTGAHAANGYQPVTWDHGANPSHNCPVCGQSQTVQDTGRVAVSGYTSQPAAFATQPARMLTVFRARSASSCPNGVCPNR